MKAYKLMMPLFAVVSLSLTSCLHKDLSYDDSRRADIYVDFDWSNAQDAAPTSMLTYFFPAGGDVLEYTFAGRDGGQIALPVGTTYCAISINGDNTYWAGLRHTDDPDRFEIYTKDADELESYGLKTRSLPRAVGTAEERIAKTPGMVWSDRQDEIALPEDIDGEKHIIFYPAEAVCHYTVDIYGVRNMSYLHGTSVDATISGMAEGYLHGKHTATDVTVTMPFTLKPSDNDTSLHAEFLTFGECNTVRAQHQLTVYMYTTDGSKWYHTFDVTSQVTDAPDPSHVHIVITGLDLPQPITDGGGFKPDVEEWQDIDIPLSM